MSYAVCKFVNRFSQNYGVFYNPYFTKTLYFYTLFSLLFLQNNIII